HGPLLTARRKEGSLEFRWAIRVHRGNGPVDRRTVQDCRRDVQHQSAHCALLIATGDLRNDARSEALNGAPVHVWAGEGLAEKFLESHSGVRVVALELFELDRAFFEDCARGAEESRRRREERHREREERSTRPEPAEPAEASGEDEDAGGDDEGDDEGPEETGPEAAAGAEGAPGERKRRRRRRRGRRGRGREGAPGAPGTEGGATASPAPEGGQGAGEPAPGRSEGGETPSGGGQSSAPEQG
ncbi:MAG TPA: restriction endonuclease, partial [Myxococcaceae bacterium]|nr:restriction endonuclease [Myxococcaceae bacterium]